MAKKKIKRPLMAQRWMGINLTVSVQKVNRTWTKDLAKKKIPAALRKAIVENIRSADIQVESIEMNSMGHNMAPAFSVTLDLTGTYTVKN